VAIGPDGTVYVAEIENHRVSVFAADGSFVRAMGKDVRPGGGDICTAATGCKAGAASASPQGLTVPIGVALGPEGRLFVSEANNNRVAVFDPNGTFNYFFGTTHLHEPRGIQFDPSGLLHVANWGDNRIDVFTSGGAFVRGIGKDVGPGGADVCTEETGCQTAPPADGSAGSMSGPEDVAFGPAGELIVSDPGNSRMDVFAANGSFLRAFGKEVDAGTNEDVCTIECQAGTSGSSPGAFASPAGVAADAAGHIYVADRLNARISLSGIDGGFIDTFDVAPEPFDVALDCRAALFVSEANTGFARIERFGEPGTPSPSCVASPSVGEPIQVSLIPLPSNRLRFHGLKLNRRNGSAVLFVRVAGPGKVFLWGRGVRRVRRGARRAGQVRLPVRPKIPLKRFLKRRGKAAIRVEVGFQPTGGLPRTFEKRVLLKRQRARRYR
jgi:hypothetical protein